MWIVVACSAGTILKPVFHGNRGAARLLLVALRTGYSEVSPGQRETRLLVTRQSEMRGLKLRDAVALFAAILIGRGSELASVHVLMAGDALRLRNLKQRVLALGNMALFAFHLGVAALEWIHARGMLLDAKTGRLEPVERVTNGAIFESDACQELAAVVIGMAIRALRKRDRRLEIPLVVAVAASYGAVFSDKRIISLVVIEPFKLCHLFPVRCVVARLAGSLERTLVRIGMTAGARGKGKPRVFHKGFETSHRNFEVSHSRVAFCAGHGGVRSRQRVLRRGVIKARRRLPACGGMAVRAIGAELSAVLILVAACARAAESQVSVVEVPYLNSRPSGG